jgi:tetratricopeptide (TPR) repeat protein
MAGLATTFVLTLALLCLSYADVRHRRNQALDDRHEALPIRLDDPDKSTDPLLLLGQANRLYWLNNGPKAAPLFARAERLFADRGDARNELYAKVGRFRSEAETMSFVELSRFIDEQLRNPIVLGDAKLRLWCLIAKGYTDIEIDHRAAKRDWLEAQGIAKNLGDDRAMTRAAGELGLIAFLEGIPGQAARLLGSALLSTMASGDTGGQVRFLELLGAGFEEVNRNAEALRFFERAIKLADAEKDSGLPFMAYEGKAQALVASGRIDEAKRVLDDALTKARLQRKKGHEAQLMILLGRLMAQMGDRTQAIAYLEGAGQFATQVQFFRMEADAMFELARLYRDAGDLATADARATQGLAASQRVGDRYYVPRNLTILADLKARRGRIEEANALYEQAEDVIEGMQFTDFWSSNVIAQHFNGFGRAELFSVITPEEIIYDRGLILEENVQFSGVPSFQSNRLCSKTLPLSFNFIR